MRLELQRKQLVRYFHLRNFIQMGMIAVPLALTMMLIMAKENAPARAYGIGLGALALLLVLTSIVMVWFAGRYVSTLQYEITDHIVHIEEGVFTYQRKAIPLDRVTDMRLIQGILMRWVGIWKIQLQTAGIGQMTAEGMLWAIENPKATRDILLTTRAEAVKQQRVDSAA